MFFTLLQPYHAFTSPSKHCAGSPTKHESLVANTEDVVSENKASLPCHAMPLNLQCFKGTIHNTVKSPRCHGKFVPPVWRLDEEASRDETTNGWTPLETPPKWLAIQAHCLQALPIICWPLPVLPIPTTCRRISPQLLLVVSTWIFQMFYPHVAVCARLTALIKMKLRRWYFARCKAEWSYIFDRMVQELPLQNVKKPCYLEQRGMRFV